MSTNTLHRILAMPVRWVSHWSGTALRRARAIRKPRILMYHIIGDDDIAARQFKWQLRFLRKHFEPVGLPELVDRMQAGSTTGREVAITFDDGVRNHYLVAWPLLRTYKVPATFFVCPGLVESGDWVWRTELRMRLKMLDEATCAAIARDAGCPARAVEAIMEWTKALPMDDRLAFQQNVEKRTPDFSSSRQQIECHAPLTWEQMRRMDDRLITIGSHSRTHPILTTLTGPALEDEIANSRRDLEERLDRRIDLFSYPNGANGSEVVGLVRRHYRAAVTTRKDMVDANEDLFLLPRIPAADSQAAFTRRMHRPTA
jgi:peptidoglycan/xylan/chitin deacetylase (PgdA/CDA1 family)